MSPEEFKAKMDGAIKNWEESNITQASGPMQKDSQEKARVAENFFLNAINRAVHIMTLTARLVIIRAEKQR